MSNATAPAGSQWQGLVRNLDTVDLPPDASPDCANAFFYEGVRGMLGPRYGKSYQGLAESRIMGVFPYRVAGVTGLLVAMANGKTVFLSSYTGAAPGGTFVGPFTSTSSSTTISAGPVTITLNQFNQIINLAWNGGAVGATGTWCAISSFNSSTCVPLYTALTFTNGILTAVDQDAVACTGSGDKP